MTPNHVLTPIEGLALARVAVGPQTGVMEAILAKDLWPIAAPCMPRADFDTALGLALDTLATLNFVIMLPAKIRKWRILPDGGPALAGWLGVKTLPSAQKWTSMRDGYLTAKALGITIKTPEGMARFKKNMGAVVIRLAYNFPLPEVPTMKQALDALTWRLLGVESTQDMKLGTVQAFLIGKELDAMRRLTPSEAKGMLLAKLTGATGAKIASITPCIVSRLFEPRPATPSSMTLDAFAHAVINTARNCATGRVGQRLVFINHVHAAFKEEFMDLSAFKTRLLQALKAELITLTRADLVQAFAPDDVAASLIQDMNAEFHFIVLPEET